MIDSGASGNTIGGSSSVNPMTGMLTGAGNLISGNENSGVQIIQASGNAIQGNFIGSDITGQFAITNAAPIYLYDQIDLLSGSNNTIGGASSVDSHGNLSGLGNLITGATNTSCVWITDATSLNGNPSVVASSGNVIEGNFVGTNVSGTTALGASNAIILDAVGSSNTLTNNTIGGTAPGLGNLVTGTASSNSPAIEIYGSGAAGNLVAGNWSARTPPGRLPWAASILVSTYTRVRITP